MSNRVFSWLARHGRRLGITILGFALVIVGAVLIPLPGPGWLVVFTGLTVLAREYEWARRLLAWARRRTKQALNKARRRRRRRES